jgi:hypothetical protein
VERAEGGVDSEEPRVIEGIEPDLALDLQRLVSERFRVQVADSD